MSRLLYKLGLGMSVLCAIHCLAMPFILILLPYVGNLYFTESTENVVVAISFVIATYFLFQDFKQHKQKLPLILLLLAAPFFVANALFHNHFATVVGSVCMLVAYTYNWRLHRKFCSNPMF